MPNLPPLPSVVCEGRSGPPLTRAFLLASLTTGTLALIGCGPNATVRSYSCKQTGASMHVQAKVENTGATGEVVVEFSLTFQEGQTVTSRGPSGGYEIPRGKTSSVSEDFTVASWATPVDCAVRVLA